MSEAVQEKGVEPAAEADRPNNPVIFGVVVVTIVALLGVLVAVNELFKATLDGEISTKVLEPPSSALRSLRAEEQQKLTHYQWVSEKDGIVRIPVDRAVALALSDYRAGRRPFADVKPTPAPSASAAPAGSADKPAPAASAAPAGSAAKPADEKAAAAPQGAKADKPADPKADKPAPKPEGAAPEAPVK